jgi:AcrR family transcriptional regulator
MHNWWRIVCDGGYMEVSDMASCEATREQQSLQSDDGERRQLIEATKTVLARSGWWGFKVESVLREAGLSTRSFYRHFEKKQDLLVAVLESELAGGARRLCKVTRAGVTPADRVRRYLDATLDMAYIESMNKPSALFSQHWRELLPDYQDALNRATMLMIEPLREAIEAGVADGDFPHARPYEDSVAIYKLAAGIAADAAAAAPHAQTRAKLERVIYPFCERALGAAPGPISAE